jgi:hypothetical protein
LAASFITARAHSVPETVAAVSARKRYYLSDDRNTAGASPFRAETPIPLTVERNMRGDIADLCYSRFFELAPDAKDLFRSDMERQRVKLMDMIAALVGSLD